MFEEIKAINNQLANPAQFATAQRWVRQHIIELINAADRHYIGDPESGSIRIFSYATKLNLICQLTTESAELARLEQANELINIQGIAKFFDSIRDELLRNYRIEVGASESNDEEQKGRAEINLQSQSQIYPRLDARPNLFIEYLCLLLDDGVNPKEDRMIISSFHQSLLKPYNKLNLNYVYGDHENLLHLICKFPVRRLARAAYLLEKGMILPRKAADGSQLISEKTPAAQLCNLIKFLLESGVNINATNKSQETPFSYAVSALPFATVVDLDADKDILNLLSFLVEEGATADAICSRKNEFSRNYKAYLQIPYAKLISLHMLKDLSTMCVSYLFPGAMEEKITSDAIKSLSPNHSSLNDFLRCVLTGDYQFTAKHVLEFSEFAQPLKMSPLFMILLAMKAPPASYISLLNIFFENGFHADVTCDKAILSAQEVVSCVKKIASKFKFTKTFEHFTVPKNLQRADVTLLQFAIITPVIDNNTRVKVIEFLLENRAQIKDIQVSPWKEILQQNKTLAAWMEKVERKLVCPVSDLFAAQKTGGAVSSSGVEDDKKLGLGKK